MTLRLQQWGEIWGLGSQPLQLICLEELKQLGVQEASHFDPLTPGFVWRTIRGLSNKASGLGEIGFDMLKCLPYEAMGDLVQYFHAVEAAGVVPIQWQSNLIALIPKSAAIERPIALVASLYRLWCKLRWLLNSVRDETPPLPCRFTWKAAFWKQKGKHLIQSGHVVESWLAPSAFGCESVPSESHEPSTGSFLCFMLNFGLMTAALMWCTKFAVRVRCTKSEKCTKFETGEGTPNREVYQV